MGRVVAVVNRKGGVGKTTTTIAVADALISEFRQSVCIIDIDPQASASIALATQAIVQLRAEKKIDLADLISAELSGHPKTDKFEFGNYNLIRGRARQRLGLINTNDGQWDFETEQTKNTNAAHYSNAVQSIIRAAAKKFDYVLIDCPPGQSPTSEAALFAADMILCPTIADRISCWGLTSLQNYISRLDPDLEKKTFFLITRFRSNLKEHSDHYDRLQKEAPVRVLRLLNPDGTPQRALARIAESTKFVQRLETTRATTLTTLYGTGGARDAEEVSRAIHRGLDHVE